MRCRAWLWTGLRLPRKVAASVGTAATARRLAASLPSTVVPGAHRKGALSVYVAQTRHGCGRIDACRRLPYRYIVSILVTDISK